MQLGIPTMFSWGCLNRWPCVDLPNPVKYGVAWVVMGPLCGQVLHVMFRWSRCELQGVHECQSDESEGEISEVLAL